MFHQRRTQQTRSLRLSSSMPLNNCERRLACYLWDWNRRWRRSKLKLGLFSLSSIIIPRLFTLDQIYSWIKTELSFSSSLYYLVFLFLMWSLHLSIESPLDSPFCVSPMSQYVVFTSWRRVECWYIHLDSYDYVSLCMYVLSSSLFRLPLRRFVYVVCSHCTP